VQTVYFKETIIENYDSKKKNIKFMKSLLIIGYKLQA